MIVIVGGGPSVTKHELGPWIDRQFVVRMKHATRNAKHHGLRMDAYFSRGLSAKKDGYDFWYFPKRPPHPEGADSAYWLNWYRKFNNHSAKPSSGLCALFCAAEFFPGAEVGLIGFDNVLDGKPFRSGPHDGGGEHAAALALNLHLYDLRTEHGQTHLRSARETQGFEFRRSRAKLSDRGSQSRPSGALDGIPLRLASDQG